MTYTLEVCVDSAASALAAKRGGADRLELCADLIVGGTTPSLALVRQVKETTGLPVRALLRPRFGDFCYDRWELGQMKESAAALVAAGAGISSLSMAVGKVGAVKASLIRHDLETCRAMLDAVLASTGPEQARAAVVELLDAEVAELLA